MAKKNRAARRAAARNSSGYRPTRTPGMSADAAKQQRLWDEWMDDLEAQINESAANSAASILRINEMLDSVVDTPVSGGQSKEAQARRSGMASFRRKLKGIADSQKNLAQGYLTEAKKSMKALQEKARQHGAESKRVSNIEREHKRRMEQLANADHQLKQRMAQAVARALSEQKALRSTRMKDYYGKSRDEIAGGISDLNDSLKRIDKYFGERAVARKRVEEKKREKYEDLRIKELSRIVNRADHSLLRRMTLDKVADAGRYIGKGISKYSGHSFVTGMIRKQRAKKEHLESLRAELQDLQMNKARRELKIKKKSMENVWLANATVGDAPNSGRGNDLTAEAQSNRVTASLQEIARNTRRMSGSGLGGLLGDLSKLLPSLSSLGSMIASALSAALGALGFKSLISRMSDAVARRITSAKSPAGGARAPQGGTPPSESAGGSKGGQSAKAPSSTPRAASPSTYSAPSRVSTSSGMFGRISDAASDAWSSTKNGVSKAANSAVNLAVRAKDATVSGAKWVGTHIGSGMNAVADWAKSTGRSAMEVVESGKARLATMGNAAKNSAMMKYIGAGGALAMKAMTMLDIASTLHAEATGEPIPTDLDPWEIVISPSLMGRIIGQEGRRRIEESTGKSLGEWMHEFLRPEDLEVARRAVEPTLPKSRPVPMSIPASPKGSEVRSKSMMFGATPGGGGASGASPNTTVNSIPNFGSSDFHVHAFSIGAL